MNIENILIEGVGRGEAIGDINDETQYLVKNMDFI